MTTSPRRPVFVSAAVVEPVCAQLLHVALEHGFAIVVYCFMPDHLHVLVAGEDEAADFQRFVSLFKQLSAYGFRRRTRENLWAPGYFERVLRDEESTVTVARYIVGNPVRAGLAAAAVDYPFSGSAIAPLADIVNDVQV